jgi:hypothetical protein
MDPTQAYRAGFFLKCAQLGLDVGVAQALYQRPESLLKSAAGQQNATAQLLATLGQGARTAVAAPAHFSSAAGAVGKGLGDSMNAEAQTRRRLGLSPEALRDLLMAAHYDRASKSLLPAAPAF